MKRLCINSSILFLMAVSHSAAAAVYEFDAVITDTGYSDSTVCADCVPPSESQDTGQHWNIGDSIGVSLEYSIGPDSPYNEDYYSLTLSDDSTNIVSASSLDYTITAQLDNSPENGGADVLSISFFRDYVNDDETIDIDTVVDIVLTDTTGTAFTDENLPEMLDLNDFSTISLSYDIFNENYQNPPYFTFYDEFIDAEYTPAPVPLPPVVYLFVSGIIGLLGISRRKTSLS